MLDTKTKKLIALIFLVIDVSAQEDWVRSNACEYSKYDNEALINRLIRQMSIEEKVGQVIQGDLDFISPEDVRKFKIGSVLNGGNTAPQGNKYSSAQDWKNLSKEFYNASPKVSGIKIPILWGTDAVHGHNNIIGATLFPHNIGLGATGNAPLVTKIGEAIALEVLSTGVVWTFAPTIAVPRDDRWGRTYEGFSEDPELVSRLGQALIFGLQGKNKTFLDNNHVLATAKHFIGDGGTFRGIDQGDTKISEDELRNIHGYPYFSALDACSQTVMASFNSWNGEKMHSNENLLTLILKNNMEFDGFVVGDWNGHGQVQNCTNDQCAQSFNAGVDMFMVPEDWRGLLKNTITQVRSGEIPIERLNDAVKRILTVKSRIGLLNGRVPHAFQHNFLGHPDHISLARQAVRESLVLLKNNSNILPLNPKKHIGIIGEAANKISSQTGGWTITWQGRDNQNEDFKNTRTIYQSIENFVIASGGTIEFSENGKFLKTPDFVIGVFGEEPYAEMLGDLKNITFMATDPRYLTQLESLSAQEIPTISIFLSGRPLEVNRYINASDAFVAAWLPGTAVEGIADVIFTKNNAIQNNFLGKLSFSWPKHKSQSVLNFQDVNYDPLFPFGYGLDYASNVTVAKIAIDNDYQILDQVNIFLGAALSPGKEFILSDELVELVQLDDFISQNEQVKISRFDYLRQDDAKNITFNLNHSLNAFGVSAKTSIDITSMKSPFYEIIIRVNDPSQSKLYFNVGCGDDCQGNVPLPTESLKVWTSLNVPVSCLIKDGLNHSSIQARSVFVSPDPISFDLHSVIIKDGPMEGVQVNC
jgi:beta-glucosidase